MDTRRRPWRRGAGAMLRAGRIALTLMGVAACAPDDGFGDPAESRQVGDSVAGEFDLAPYIIPSCDAAGPTWRTNNGQVRRVIPLGVRDGRARYFIAKSADGLTGEEWSIDRDAVRIHFDTTWSHDAGLDYPCDIRCGRGINYAADCRRRWQGHTGDFAFTRYEDRDGNLGAVMLPRRVRIGQRVDRSFRVVGQSISRCARCDTDFSGDAGSTAVVQQPTGGRWHGFTDVIYVEVVAGAGGGERYYYARGVGWVGFRNVHGHEEWSVERVGDAPLAANACGVGGSTASSICAVVGGGSAPPVPPPVPPPPPPSSGCACRSGVDNFCNYPANTAGCGMTQRGGYCDPNGDGSFSDADWVRGYNEYRAACTGTSPPPSPSPSPGAGTRVALRAANGQYVVAEGGGGGVVNANRNAIGAWETFVLVDRGGGNVALRAANGQYLVAEGGGGRGGAGSVNANRSAVGAWETFGLIDAGGGRVALRTQTGHYVVAENGGGTHLAANRTAVGAWERFELVRRP